MQSVEDDAGSDDGDERDGVDGDDHVLSHGTFVSETLNKGRVEVAQCGRSDNDHVAKHHDPGTPVRDSFDESFDARNSWGISLSG